MFFFFFFCILVAIVGKGEARGVQLVANKELEKIVLCFCSHFRNSISLSLDGPHVAALQYWKTFISSFFFTQAPVLSCCGWLLDFLAPLGWAQRACLGLIRESLSDTGMTLNTSWHNASAPSRLSGRSGITQPRLTQLMLVFFQRERVWGQFAVFACVCMCFTNQLSKVLHITFSSCRRCCATSWSLQWKADSTHGNRSICIGIFIYLFFEIPRCLFLRRVLEWKWEGKKM